MTATKTESAFRMDCTVRCGIRATPEKIWALLTDAEAFRLRELGVDWIESDDPERLQKLIG